MALFSLKEIQERRAELLDECDAILAVCKEEGREPNEQESEKIEGNMAECDALDPQEVTARKLDAHKAKAAAIRSLSPQASIEGPQAKPAKPVIYATPTSSLKAFKGPNAGQEAHNVGMWLKANLMNDQEARRYCVENRIGNVMADAQTADDYSKGGLFVPTEMSNAIIRIINEVGISRRLARVIPMNAETLSIPKRSSGQTVYYPAEVAEVTSSEAQWTRISLTTKDRAALTRISHGLMRGAAVSVGDLVTTEMGYAFADKEDSEFIDGDGTSTYGQEIGLVSALGSAGTKTLATTSGDTWDEIVLSDFSATKALLPSKYRMNQVWVCSSAFYESVMARLLNAAGGNTIASLQAGDADAMFLGKPVYFTDYMPTSTATSTVQCLYGSLSDAVIIGVREGISISTSTERYFETREIGILGQQSYDIEVHEGGDASNAGAYVGLKTGAAS